MFCIISVHLRAPAEAPAQAGIPLCTFVLKKSVNQYLEYVCRMGVGFFSTEERGGMHTEEPSAFQFVAVTTSWAKAP